MTKVRSDERSSGTNGGMRIRTKMISLVALLFAVLSVIEIAIQSRMLMPSFAELERDDAQTSMRRIGNALGRALENLEFHAADWGNWLDTYRYMQRPNWDFERENLTPYALKRININAILLIDMDGEIVLSTARDLATGATLRIDFLERKVLPADFPWRKNLAAGAPARGFIQTNQGIMMMAAAPILNGSGAGRAMGMMIIGRLLTPDQVQMLGAQAEAKLIMTQDLTTGAGDQIVETDTVTRIYRSVGDVYGRPLMHLRVDVPRRITARGRDAVIYASAYLIGAAIFILALLVVALTRVVLQPLARVTRHAIAIGEGTDLSTRLELPGNDEIARLAQEFDRMVERVAESRRELVDKSFQAGFAELAKGVLHNLGNAMTPLGVRLSKLGGRLRAAPINDMEMALSELAKPDCSPARRTDLEKFLYLGCREVAVLLKDSQADLEVIQRQSDIVRIALTELMRSTRNEYVVESVRLPELVAQTLEIVPDASRQRLIVDTDESLQRVGVVHVARTALRMILQNFIINAADAVRDAGRAKGMLHVAAEIVHESDVPKLHLCCKDNGIGIAADKLARVFDKGFSTKSRDTNYGIGLHWCANTIRALGGRVWADSEGPGLGASLHLMMPMGIYENRSNVWFEI